MKVNQRLASQGGVSEGPANFNLDSGVVRTYGGLRPVLGGKYENFHKARVIPKVSSSVSQSAPGGGLNDEAYIQISKREKGANQMALDEDSKGRKIEASIMSPGHLVDQPDSGVSAHQVALGMGIGVQGRSLDQNLQASQVSGELAVGGMHPQQPVSQSVELRNSGMNIV